MVFGRFESKRPNGSSGSTINKRLMKDVEISINGNTNEVPGTASSGTAMNRGAALDKETAKAIATMHLQQFEKSRLDQGCKPRRANS